MRLRSPAWWVVGLVCGALSAPAQGTFQNLDFESATLVPVAANRVQFAPAFLGWTGTVGGVQQSSALYNDYNLGTSAISILDHGWPYSSFGGVIGGNYTALLQAGVVENPNPTPADTTLSQTGLVPLGTESLQFKALLDLYLGGSFSVTLGGQTLSLIPLQSGANYTLYGADIRGWAGHTAELDFTVSSPGNSAINYVFLDSIQFSNQVIPEPGVLSLSALGALLLGRRVLGRRR